MKKNKPLVDLSCVDIEPCIIVPFKSGVIYTNQTDGIACKHPVVEGILIPLRYTWNAYKDDDFTAYLCPDRSIEKEYPNAKHIENYIKKFNLPLKLLKRKWRSKEFEFLSGEAWIPVRILKHEDTYSPLKDFIGYEAILTYQNSD